MDRLQKILVIALVGTSALGWIASQVFQMEMMSAMAGPNDAMKVSVFVPVWTAGMAAMMFPAISPIVLLYNRLSKSGSETQSIMAEEEGNATYGVKMIIFIGSYLAVWSLAGVALLLAWSVPAAGLMRMPDTPFLGIFFGSILMATGAYQFSPLKSKCLGYCESPMSFFMRRWRKGTSGALTMGTYHGVYCLGCCWPYFLIMVALGWMDILWMALFAGIIFVEKIWSNGIWVARAVGVGLMVTGAAVTIGLVNVSGNEMMSTTNSMPMSEDAQEQSPIADQLSRPVSEDSMDSDNPTTKDPMTDVEMSGMKMYDKALIRDTST